MEVVSITVMLLRTLRNTTFAAEDNKVMFAEAFLGEYLAFCGLYHL